MLRQTHLRKACDAYVSAIYKCCFGSVELFFEKRLKPFVIKCIRLERCLKVEYNDPHKHASNLYAFPYTS